MLKPQSTSSKPYGKNGVRGTKSQDTKKLLVLITAISVFLAKSCQGGEMTKNKW
jgi:hypothetical protein